MEFQNSKVRMSPDITCISSYNTDHSSVTEPTVSAGSSANTSSGNFNSISEVPPGLYEFIVGSNGEIRILCKICQYMSNKKSNFKRHFTNMHFVHTEDSSKVLECCGIRFTTKGEKFQHTKSVHKSGYKCTICSKVFDRPALLQRHLAKHTGKKPYKCSLCSYQTPNKANAKRHIEKKHSDVQEGSILFVTDDGEQIQMEVVSKGVRDVDQRSFLASSQSIQSAEAVVKSNADSTSFGSFAENALGANANLTLSRSRSASSDTSSSLSPPGPGQLFSGPLESIFDETIVADISDHPGQEKKRKISHSIDTIMKQHAQSHFINSSGSPTCSTSANASFTATCCTQKVDEGNNTSVSSENLDSSSKYSPNYNHPTINELHMGSYCSSNWLRSSSLFPINNESATRTAHQAGFLQPSIYTSAASATTTDVRNQNSPSFVFRQCVHGCWHHVDNQISSDSSSSPKFEQEVASLFVPTHFFPHQSPDLRSSSSSTSHQTENSSIISLKSEDENDSDIIDVVGDDDDEEDDEDDDGDDNSRRLQLLSSLCKGLGSLSSAEIPSPPGEGNSEECKIKHFDSPPVESVQSRSSSFSSDSTGSAMEEQDSAEAERYVPKKLRVARGHYK